MRDRKVLVIFIVLGVIFTILGATLAYWSWASTNAQKTNVTFTIGSNFSCGADGGGIITNTNYFVPTSCNNSTYAIKREIIASINNSGNEPVFMDMWLTINSIGSGLSGSQNFNWRFSTNGEECADVDSILGEGNFYGLGVNDKIPLLSGAEEGDTYYLYIWLDEIETNPNTMNQSVSLSIGGECTNANPYVYTANIYDVNNPESTTVLGSKPIPNTITTYSTPEAAMAALKQALDGTYDYPVFFRHKLGTTGVWCDVDNINTCWNKYSGNGGCRDGGGNCQLVLVPNAVIESYVGFVITNEMANGDSEMVPGTYYLRGGNYFALSMENSNIIEAAFGSDNCTRPKYERSCNDPSGYLFAGGYSLRYSMAAVYNELYNVLCKVDVDNYNGYTMYSSCEVTENY